MKIPFPNEVPAPLRKAVHNVLPARLRHRIAADLQHVAHLQSRFDPRFRRSVQALTDLRDRHRGETCVIVGNGPSMAKFELARLAGVPTFCLNRGYLLWQAQGLQPDYFVAVNNLVLEQFQSDIRNIKAPKFLPWEYVELFEGCGDAIFVEMRWHDRFFTDCRQGLWPGGTVTFAAMQLAHHMGFSKVVLIGVDHLFADSGQPHAEVTQNGDDQNHFSPAYFGPGVRWNLPDLSLSAQAYRMAATAFQGDGRCIIDATDNGRLDIFPKMPLERALA